MIRAVCGDAGRESRELVLPREVQELEYEEIAEALEVAAALGEVDDG